MLASVGRLFEGLEPAHGGDAERSQLVTRTGSGSEPALLSHVFATGPKATSFFMWYVREFLSIPAALDLREVHVCTFQRGQDPSTFSDRDRLDCSFPQLHSHHFAHCRSMNTVQHNPTCAAQSRLTLRVCCAILRRGHICVKGRWGRLALALKISVDPWVVQHTNSGETLIKW